MTIITNDLSNRAAMKMHTRKSKYTTISCLSKWTLVQWSCRRIRIEVKQQIKCTLHAHNNSSNMHPNYFTKRSRIYHKIQCLTAVGAMKWHHYHIVNLHPCRQVYRIIASSIVSYFEHLLKPVRGICLQIFRTQHRHKPSQTLMKPYTYISQTIENSWCWMTIIFRVFIIL